jgi:acetyl esterase/lipase
VKDGNSAVRWMRANAPKLGVDPERIAAGGGSAGGMVAACTALTPGVEEEGENIQTSSQPDALVLFNPVVDMLRHAEALGLSADEAESVSPLHHVREGLPPCIIFHGEEDAVVPIERVRTFCRLMKKAQNRCEVVGYEGVGHAFFNYGRGESHAYFRDTVYRADRFLLSLGWLEGEPAIQPPEELSARE